MGTTARAADAAAAAGVFSHAAQLEHCSKTKPIQSVQFGFNATMQNSTTAVRLRVDTTGLSKVQQQEQHGNVTAQTSMTYDGC
jgi:hypothetical protein